MVEEVFLATESAFDATKLTERMREALHQSGVEVRLRSQALRLDTDGGERLVVRVAGPSGEQPVSAEMVFNCTYAAMNRLLASSELPIIPVGYEQAELAIVDPPEVLSDKAITVMCGPFFSLMPFPPLRKHTLSHVRYTPHMSWEDSDASVASTPNAEDPERLASTFVSMICDARRYVPCLAECRLSGSLWETKAVLPTSAVDDSRPILFRAHHAIPNLFCVMGGKIDNVYDVLDEIDLLMQQRLAG
jgi:glycine/D-amino acid oxidase-like deaminating enzyme